MSTTSNNYFSTTSMDVVLDDQSFSDSNEDESQSTDVKSMSNDAGSNSYTREKSTALRNPKSHRLIEKRRRDRLNRSLAELLDLVPHQKPENQRRIEKIEIIDMAIKYIRKLMSMKEISYAEENNDGKAESYRTGYQNAIGDIYEYLQKHPNHSQFQNYLLDFIRQRELDMGDLQILPEKKIRMKTKKLAEARCDTSHSIDESPPHPVESASSSRIETAKVPCFVLHPSGTHYIPLCLDASLLTDAFPSALHSPHVSQPLQCHPVSIPVNFHPSANLNDPYSLDVQNINVIGSLHQTSVRPH